MSQIGLNVQSVTVYTPQAAPEPSMPALPDLEWRASSADGGVQQAAPAPAGRRSSEEPATPTRDQKANSDTVRTTCQMLSCSERSVSVSFGLTRKCQLLRYGLTA